MRSDVKIWAYFFEWVGLMKLVKSKDYH